MHKKSAAHARNHRAEPLPTACRLTLACAALLWIAIQPTSHGAQQVESAAPVITARGPDDRVWTRKSVTVRDGRFQTNVVSFTEVASGLHYLKNNQWEESREQFDLIPGAALASQARHQVQLARNLNSAGAVQFLTPEGQRLRSHVLGLAYTDAASGKSTLFAEIKDTVGELVAPNQILYRDAFTDVHADVAYTFTKAGFEQNVILRENPPPPAGYGFSETTTRVEIWTEFIEAPEPVKTRTTYTDGFAVAAGVALAIPLADDELRFGNSVTTPGRAFSLADDPPATRRLSTLRVFKTWERIDNRNLLIEAVRYPDARARLARLPQAAALRPPPLFNRGPQQARAVLPAAPPARRETAVMKTASLPLPAQGFTIDYQILNSSYSDRLFQGDTTYWITDYVILSGTTTFEGGTVIKYAHTNYCILDIRGPIVCNTDTYRPAIFTIQSDCSAGENVDTTTGLTNFFSQAIGCGRSDVDLKHIRISYAQYALHTYGFKLRHSQFLHCDKALYTEGGNGQMEDVLMYDIGTMFHGSTYNVGATHLTLHNCDTLTADYSNPAYSTVALTNSLLVGVTNSGGVAVSTNTTESPANDGTVFTVVGAGAHYLAPNSPYRNAGSTNGLSATLRAELKQRTTYPPVVLSGVCLNLDTTLTPQAQRDTDLPDLGFHPAPLDYVLIGNFITNATLTLSGGVALGIAPTNAAGYGLGLAYGGRLVSVGVPTALNRIVRCNTVQEQANTSWISASPSIVQGYWSTPATAAQFKFTEFSALAGGPSHLEMAGSTDDVGFIREVCTWSDVAIGA